MIRQQKSPLITTSGLRTRYFPRARISQGLVSVCPWLDLVLLIILFVLVDSQWVLQPGVVVELPRVPFREGSHFGMVAVVIPAHTAAGGEEREIIFFDDERYIVQDKEQMQNLKRKLAVNVRRHSENSMVVHADRDVPQGTVMDLVNMALEVGVEKVNIAARPFADTSADRTE